MQIHIKHLYAILLSLVIASTIGCATIVEEDETASWSARQFYQEAQKAIKEGDFQSAIDLFSKLEARYPYGHYAQQSQLETAFIHYKNDEPGAAIAAADRFIKLHPQHKSVDYAYYLRGLASYSLDPDTLERWTGQDLSERDPQRTRESFNYFRILITRFPETKYRKDAVKRMRELRNSLAQHEVNVANYYLRSGTYLAAANRAKYVIENYPKTPAVTDALKIMAEAYRQLKLDNLADDAESVLKLNRPEK
ncbi:MAG: outer membrane protein assembly factor BamD [Gammaproteobacteria bacterium]|nr:outer membrane protein assembly factor BamD [Gammaproteobacteria bacterium]